MHPCTKQVVKPLRQGWREFERREASKLAPQGREGNVFATLPHLLDENPLATLPLVSMGAERPHLTKGLR